MEERVQSGRAAVDSLVDRVVTIPFAEDDRAPIPSQEIYAPLRALLRTGFSFRLRDLLHVIGVKTCPLPQSRREAVANAYLFSKLLYLDDGILRIRSVNSDLDAIRSQELGIGAACLMVNRLWNIPYESLEAIKGKGRRFDYRGARTDIRAIVEAKGTKYRSKQERQIADGLKKKQAHHDRGESFDIELIVSTAVGPNIRPRIMLADPEFTEFESAFGPASDEIYRQRHYARVCGYAGAPLLALQLRKSADAVFVGVSALLAPRSDREVADQVEQLHQVQIAGRTFAGRWVSSWLPQAVSTTEKRKKYERRVADLPPKLILFQGCELSILRHLIEGVVDQPLILDLTSLGPNPTLDTGEVASVFDDGSVLVARAAT